MTRKRTGTRTGLPRLARLLWPLCLLALGGCVRPVLPELTVRPALFLARAVSAVAVDKDENRIVAGGFADQMVLSKDGELHSAGGKDVFVAKFDRQGKTLWSRRYGDALDQVATGVAVDQENNILITGTFQGVLDLGGGALQADRRRPKAAGIFLAKLDPEGKLLWSRVVGLINAPAQVSVAVGPSGKIVVGASLVGIIVVGKEKIGTKGSSVFVAEFGPDGSPTPTVSFLSSSFAICRHTPCQMGAALSAFCDPCVGFICDSVNPSCCTSGWTRACVEQIWYSCGQSCWCNVCSTGPRINPQACSCAGAICDQDSYCCTNEWDAICVSEVLPICQMVCSP